MSRTAATGKTTGNDITCDKLRNCTQRTGRLTEDVATSR